MVNFENLMKSTHNGTIQSVVKESLESSLGTPEKVKAFIDASWKNLPKEVKEMDRDEQELYKRERLLREGITFTILVDGEKTEKGEPLTFKQHETIPKTTGYRKSNLKGIIEKNNLPPDTDMWKGKTVALMVNEDGYWRIAS